MILLRAIGLKWLSSSLLVLLASSSMAGRGRAEAVVAQQQPLVEYPTILCPVPGTYDELLRIGHRFMFESQLLYSKACIQEALDIHFGKRQPRKADPDKVARFEDVYLKSTDVPPGTFDDLSKVIELWNKKTRDRYALHLTPEPGDYLFRRKRPEAYDVND